MHRHLARCRLKLPCSVEHLQVFEFRHKFRNGIRELKLTLLIQLHRRDRCDWLGHRVNSEEIVDLHG